MHKITPMCSVCGETLDALDTPDNRSCMLCGEVFEAYTACPAGHDVCGTCRQKHARNQIVERCLQSDQTDLCALVISLMELPFTLMHGPEHHLLLTAALLTVHHNQTGQGDLRGALEEANRRTLQVPGAACGHWGICGAAVGTGVFASLLMETSPYSGDEWKVTGQLVARSSDAISVQGGPRCCKRDTFTAMEQAMPYCNTHMGTRFTLPEDITCTFFPNNRECKGQGCPYFPVRKS